MKLEHIDCSTAQEVFASKLLNNPKTYFLNGKWGSGKSTFLKEIEKKHNIKLIEINLWKTDIKGSIYAHAFFKLNFFLFGFILFVIFGGILLASSKITSSILVVFAISILALGKYFLPTPDNLYLWLLKYFTLHILSDKRFIPKFISDYYPYSWAGVNFIKNVTKKVIIFDDFDRADSKIQNQAYILFNILRQNPLLSIVFIGDYSKIERTNDGFIQKIIDERIELPYEIEPRNIWDEYFKNLESQIEIVDIKIDPQFKQFFIIEERNLRDLKQFNEYVEFELFTLVLYDKVNINQKLIIIYIYLFHYQEYIKVKNNKLELLQSKDYISYLNSKDKDYSWRQYQFSNIGDLTYSLLCEKANPNTYPKPFDHETGKIRNYIMHQQPKTMGIIEIQNILKDEIELEKYLQIDIPTDFSTFVSTKFNDWGCEISTTLREKSISLYRRDCIGFALHEIIRKFLQYRITADDLFKGWGIPDNSAFEMTSDYENEMNNILFTHFLNNKEPSKISHLVATSLRSKIIKMAQECRYESAEDEEVCVIKKQQEKWDEIFKGHDINSDSSKIIFLKNWAHYSYSNLSKMYNSLSINEIEKLKDQENSSILLLHYLSAQNLWGKISDWDDNIKNIIENFSPQEYIHFWENQSMLQQKLPYHDKKYIVAFSGDYMSNEDKIEARKLIISKEDELLKNHITLIISEDTSQ